MVVSYPKEILIEKGWMAYSNFLVNNSGDSDIHNLVISIEDPYNWFEFRENRTDIIAVNNATSFIAKIDVPAETLVGSYNFSLKLKSDELLSFWLNVLFLQSF